MKSFKSVLSAAVIILLISSSISYTQDNTHGTQVKDKKYEYFDNPQVCSGCHWDRFKRWNISQHSRGYTGDFFQAQFFDVVLPSETVDEKVKGVHEGCIGCHSPTSFLSNDMIPGHTKNPDNIWNNSKGYKTLADRGIFCDFCHTLEGVKNDPPFNFDYISGASEEIDPKRADLEDPWSPYHDTDSGELLETTKICASCHNELNPYGIWVKATELEYTDTVYEAQDITCQTCHMQPMGGKPAKMGPLRENNHDHWFGGGFDGFVEGAAKVNILAESSTVTKGEKIAFKVRVHGLATGHKFPTGSSEERDVWLHVTALDVNGRKIDHIKVQPNPGDPNDKYFITSNAKDAYPSHSRISEPIVRDALPEGDRLYHSAFLDSDGKFTYAQWFATEEIENRLEPDEIREEEYVWNVPSQIPEGVMYLRAVLNYRRMPDSFADLLKIKRRPTIEVSRDEIILRIIK